MDPARTTRQPRSLHRRSWRGLGLPGGQGVRYVVDKHADGTVIIGGQEDLAVFELRLEGYNPVCGELPQLGQRLGLQVRHRGKPVLTEVTEVSDQRLTLRPVDPLMGAARGQAGVLFEDDRVIGGGTIDAVIRATEA